MEKEKVRYTRKNKNGIKMRWTCLIALEKMKSIKRSSTTKLKLTGQCDWDKMLTNMNKWYLACQKCPPRHYGSKWNKEKEIILRQCEEIYLDMIKYSKYYPTPFMGNDSGLAGPSDRYIKIGVTSYLDLLGNDVRLLHSLIDLTRGLFRFYQHVNKGIFIENLLLC